MRFMSQFLKAYSTICGIARLMMPLFGGALDPRLTLLAGGSYDVPLPDEPDHQD